MGKVAKSISLDVELVNEIEKHPEWGGVSQFLNEAGWERIRRLKGGGKE